MFSRAHFRIGSRVRFLFPTSDLKPPTSSNQSPHQNIDWIVKTPNISNFQKISRYKTVIFKTGTGTSLKASFCPSFRVVMEE